jgi:hypothetical protein
MANFIHPAHLSLSIVRNIHLTESDPIWNDIQNVIDIWTRADNSRSNPKETLRLFGEGFSLWLKLPESIKAKTVTYIKGALGDVSIIANTNRNRVTFTDNGTVFS